MSDLYAVFDNLARNSFGFNHLEEYANRSEKTFPPHSIIVEDSNKWILKVALAGYDSDDIQVHKTDETLKVQSKKKPTENQRKVDYVYKGIAERSFSLSWAVDPFVEVENAEMKNGMLTITLVKKEPRVEVKQIPVSAA